VRRSGAKAIVVEGTGLGHVNKETARDLGKFVKAGGLAFMTSQCIGGRVDLNVYDTGRDLQAEGVIPLDDMLAETALVKAMWALGNGKTLAKVKELMTTDIAGETTTRTFPGRP